MNDDELLQSLHALGRPDTAAPAAELSRVRRSIRRRRRLRVGAAASVSTLAVAAVAIGVVVSNPSDHVDQIQPIHSGPSTYAPVTVPTSPRVTLSSPPASVSPTTPRSVPVSTAPATAATDVFAELVGSGPGFPAGPDDGAVVLRSAVDGHLIRVLVAASTTSPNIGAEVSPSGHYVYYARQTGQAGSATIYRLPLDGGAAQVVSGPPAAGTILPLPSDDDAELAWVTTSTTGVYTVYVSNGTGGQLRDLGTLRDGTYGSSYPVGWSPDGARLYVSADRVIGRNTATQVASVTLQVRAIEVSDPTTSRVITTADSRATGDDGACGGPSEAVGVTTAGTLVVVTDGCSTVDPSLVTEIDASSGRTTASFRLASDLDGATVESVAATPSGDVVLDLHHMDCYSTHPVVFVHGSTVTRPAIDDQRCSTAPTG